MVDDLVLLGTQAGGGQNVLKTLERPGNPQGKFIVLCGCACGEHSSLPNSYLCCSLDSLSECPVEDIFLSRLIQKDFIESNNHDEVINFVEEALALRQSSTRELLKLLENAIDSQIERTYCMTQSFKGLTSEGQKIFICFPVAKQKCSFMLLYS